MSPDAETDYFSCTERWFLGWGVLKNRLYICTRYDYYTQKSEHITSIFYIKTMSAMWTRYMISKQWVRIVGKQQLVGFPIPGCRVAEGRAPCSFFVLLMMIKKKNVRQTSSCKINISLTRQIYLTRWTNRIFNTEWFIFQYWQIDFIIWTNTFDNINKYISKAGQTHFTILTTTFCYQDF